MIGGINPKSRRKLPGQSPEGAILYSFHRFVKRARYAVRVVNSRRTCNSRAVSHSSAQVPGTFLVLVENHAWLVAT